MCINEFQEIEFDVQEAKNAETIPNMIRPKLQKEKIISNSLLSFPMTAYNAVTSSLTYIKDHLLYGKQIMHPYPIDLSKEGKVNIFDKVFTPTSEAQKEKMKKYLNIIILFTYRSGFEPIYTSHGDAKTTDCGWGCMIRCGQMILSKALLDIKLYSIDNFFRSSGETISTKDSNALLIDETTINKEKIKVILQFFDNPLNIEDFDDNEDLMNYINKGIGIKKVSDLSLKDKVIPPFSIANIFEVGKPTIKKEPGEWFGSANLTNIFSRIVNQFVKPKNLVFFTFPGGFIDERTMIMNCFTNKIISVQNKITKKGRDYCFMKAGVIFVSVRIGMEKIEESYFDSIRKIFEIKNNLGIIGGRTNKAYYFIGTCKEGLLYLDPHFNQEAIKNKNDLLVNTNFNTYNVKDVYCLKFEDLSPSFTVGFIFRSFNEYIRLIEDINKYVSETNESSVFTFQNYG